MQLPRFAPVEQRLYARRVRDIEAAVSRACDRAGLAARVRQGERVAITVGSRGIASIGPITSALVRAVKRLGANPFIIPAMGSHGGATAAGQTALLESLGVSRRSVGAPIRASMAVSRIGRTTRGVPVYVSREALQADRVIVMNRVKQHTDFVGNYESGLIKMLAVGLGKREGAMAMHSRQCASLREDVPEAAAMMMKRLRIAAGVAILENGYNEVAEIVGIPPADIAQQERVLLRRVRRTAARLPFRDIDLLIVDWIGKDISGVGMDTHVIGRRMLWEEPNFRGPRIRLIAVLNLTAASRGNSLGIGLADLTTSRVVEGTDWTALRTNVLHTGWLNRAKMPLAFESDREVLEAAMVGLGEPQASRVRIVRISDTLHLGRLQVSEGLLAEARRHARLRLLGRPAALKFDRRGNLDTSDLRA